MTGPEVFSTEHAGYPFALCGEPADAPTPVDRHVVELARRVAARQRAAAEPVYELAQWRPAASLEVLLAEADAANPRRDRSSDGTIGDSRHAARLSDHNPDGHGVVRALDLDVDGLDLPTAFERVRALAAAGKLPQLVGGGYLILHGRITAPDFARWHIYTGPDPHVSHGHVSSSRDPARYDLRIPWGAFAKPAPKPAKRPPAPAPAGHDLTGRGSSLRGAEGDVGPRVAALQAFLRRYAPAYAGELVVDSRWGAKTSAALRTFAHRSGVPESDGRNVGPRVAAALYRAGFDRTAAQARVLGHVRRADRR